MAVQLFILVVQHLYALSFDLPINFVCFVVLVAFLPSQGVQGLRIILCRRICARATCSTY
jgi:hypothetical protein